MIGPSSSGDVAWRRVLHRLFIQPARLSTPPPNFIPGAQTCCGREPNGTATADFGVHAGASGNYDPEHAGLEVRAWDHATGVGTNIRFKNTKAQIALQFTL